ncbi:DUF4224 domain-containing protein [Pectobacterium brasiliense]|uniref:excisionase n=1 Tax=Pectobacterium phage ZF40 TaxID=1127516 RepID=UPI0002536E32|nr:MULTISPECIES: DUF4224 domain-containing protein [Pectobacterium]YP_007006912.1 excisionase [Pectobacterium phage ZF40]AFC22455.1 hypothetical protein ZF40_0003 [Pectobacterium phage ZF40]MCA5919295.1 DUF4224 domain-containing protein [Pectobacterium brasiliense]MCA5926318.1 DUF4224 domain-containing protein [Pectobacterium brasiliense]MCA5935666.1 DUF4224 domain-containing protein [Pectobacterium brasiliense]MCA5941597.1 DUF4224 domain-containing protein [Pectobacterium brasiliense]
MTDLLTDDELIELTGYKYPSKQCAALTRSGISFVTRRDGRPGVTWTAINASLSAVKAEQSKAIEQPNFDAI